MWPSAICLSLVSSVGNKQADRSLSGDTLLSCGSVNPIRDLLVGTQDLGQGLSC